MQSLVTFLTPDLATAAAVAVLAGLMRGFAGFGSGMLMAPVYAIVFGPLEAVVIVVMLEIFASLQLVPRVWPDIQWRFVAPLGAVAVLFMPLGAHVLRTADPEIMTRVMAGIVLLFVLVLMTGWRYAGPKRLLPTCGVGALSGTLMAATSMGNPPVLLYMLSGRDSATTNRANIIAYFGITQGVLRAVFLAMGLLSWPPILRAVLLAPVFLVAAWIGGRLFRQTGEALYRRVALLFLLAVACYGLAR